MIGIMLDSADEVDQLTERTREAGAQVTEEPVDAEFFEGRSSYLCDPKSNFFEFQYAIHGTYAPSAEPPVRLSARDSWGQRLGLARRLVSGRGPAPSWPL